MTRRANRICTCGCEEFDHSGGACTKCGKCPGFTPAKKVERSDRQRLATQQLHADIAAAVRAYERNMYGVDPVVPSAPVPKPRRIGHEIPVLLSPDQARQFEAPKKLESAFDGFGGTGEPKKLGRVHRVILTVLKARGSLPSREQLGVACLYAWSSGAFGNALSDLRTLGYLSQGAPTLTEAGAAVEVNEEIFFGRRLREEWQKKVGKMGKLIIEALLTAPGGVDREWLGASTQYEAGSGAFGNKLSELRSLALIQGYGTEIKLNPLLKKK